MKFLGQKQKQLFTELIEQFILEDIEKIISMWNLLPIHLQ